MIAPTRSGKGVGSIIPTCLNFPGSMIIFDPKGELFFTTSGFRRQFSRILKFSPISRDTVCFNPMAEVELNEQAFADIGLILGNMFEEPKGGHDGASAFFDNMAQDLLTGLVFHVLASGIYPKERQNLNGVLGILSQAAAKTTDDEGEETGAGDALLHEMMESTHYDKDGKASEYIHTIISNAAARCLGQHTKVRSDTFTTVFSKMRLFEDPNIAYVTGHSDFRLQDFYDSDAPITLYLTVPFSDITRIAPVFKLLINFILNKFSRGEATYGELKLKNRILFLLDEFPVLGAFPFLSKTLGILAGYGITFYIVVQALNQIVDLYGANHTFLDNCKTVCVYAPGKIEDAKIFTEMIGKESVVKESLSASGSRYAVAFNNLNASSQEVARELMNPDELMKLPPTEALIMNQGAPPYIAKKVVYYMDRRFKDKAYSRQTVKRHKRLGFIPLPFITEITEKTTGFMPPATREELELEVSALPSSIRTKAVPKTIPAARPEARVPAPVIPEESSDEFNPLDYLESYDSIEEFASPLPSESGDGEKPPLVIPFDIRSFSKEGGHG
jgi:type IV secretion system protein VirD4